MKCSVCAQDIPEDRYSEHLESEHGVTDDPTAVLIQHLTGLHSGAGEGDGGEGDGDDGLPDEEPSDADAFEEFLAAHPRGPAADGDEDEDEEAEEEPAAEAPEPEPAAAADEDEDEDADEEEPEEDDADESDEGDDSAEGADDEELTDEDEAEFERMLATYPEVDLRKGRPESQAPEADAGTEDAAAAAAAGAAATTVATADRDETAVRDDTAVRDETAARDDKTFAVWDEARPGSPDDEDVVLAVPPAELEKARRRRQLAFLGLGACVILVAIAVIYLLTRDTSTKSNTTATSPSLTTATTTATTFLPGPANGEPTTVVTQPPITTSPPATTATPATQAPATTVAPSTDPGSKIVFSYSGATCTASGGLTVFGSITNTNSATYTFSYTIILVRDDGTQQGTANGQVSHLPPGGRFAPPPGQGIASGTCTYPLVHGPTPRQQITSISPG